MKKYKIGYTTGVFDLFHIGHLNLLRQAKKQCEYLMVGVSSDDLVTYKNKRCVIPFEERIQIVQAIRYVDEAIPQLNMNKMEAWEAHPFNVIFVGDDWKNTKRWNRLEEEFGKIGVDIVYFPYTKSTSSTLLTEALLKLNHRMI